MAKRLVILGILSCVVAAVTLFVLLRNAPVPPTNVLFVVLDTTRGDAFKTYGYSRDTSPNIEKLAEESLIFDRVYTHVPWTTPSVASILTSLTPHGHGISDWGDPLLEAFITLPEVYKEQGYQTHGIVSHHALREAFNLHQGFDVYDYSIVDAHAPDKSSTSHLVTEKGLSALDELTKVETPFFLWLHYFDAHNDYMPHEGISFGQRPRDLYDGELKYQDQALGELFAGLEERGLKESTIVVIIADHGEEFKEHGKVYHTGQLYEESVRIPLMIRYPGFKPARISQLLAETDVAPTLLGLMGLPVPDQFQGFVIPEQEKWLAPLRYREFDEFPNQSVYLETFRFNRRQGLVRNDWKLIHNLQVETWELYNLKTDPREKNNLITVKPKVRKTMKRELASRLKEPRKTLEDEPLDEETVKILQSLGYLE